MEQKVKLISPNSNEECTEAAYLAELSISRKAKKNGKELPFKFWNVKEWKREYITTIMAAHSLLKLFDFQSILNTLNSPDGKWMYSLTYEGLIPLIQQEQKKMNFEKKLIDSREPIEHTPQNVTHVPKPQTRKTKLDSLRD